MEVTGKPLSAREQSVVNMTLQGLSAKEMARTIGVSPATIPSYKSRAAKKLGYETTAALRKGLAADRPLPAQNELIVQALARQLINAAKAAGQSILILLEKA